MLNKRLIKYIICIVVLLIILVITGKSYLVINEPPRQADVIILLSGDKKGHRLNKAIELYNQGYAEYIILSNSDEKGSSPSEAIALGIPKNKLILEDQATSTYTNATFTKEKMVEHEFQSAIIVTSDFHMRRTKLSFDRVFEESGVQLTYVSNDSLTESWMLGTKNILSEWVKLAGYQLGMYKLIDL